MEQKLSDTREDMIRLEGKIDVIIEKISSTVEDITEIKMRCKDEDKRICKLESKQRDREISWKTLAKMGITSVTVITILIAIADLLLRGA